MKLSAGRVSTRDLGSRTHERRTDLSRLPLPISPGCSQNSRFNKLNGQFKFRSYIHLDFRKVYTCYYAASQYEDC